jgi:hypothetical protein
MWVGVAIAGGVLVYLLLRGPGRTAPAPVPAADETAALQAAAGA